MALYKHSRVLSLIGICLYDFQDMVLVAIVMDLMEDGDLQRAINKEIEIPVV